MLKTKELVKPRVPYSHFIFHLGRLVVQNRKALNLLGTNLGTVGPFCSAHSAWITAKQSELKLGMSLRELERFMTRMRKDRKTEVQIVPRAGGRARPKDAHQGRLTSAAGPMDARGRADGRGRRTDAGPTDARGGANEHARQCRLRRAAGPTDARGGAYRRGRRTRAGPTDARGGANERARRGRRTRISAD